MSARVQGNCGKYKASAANGGFSLIELVIAILILGIVAAVGMSRSLRGDIYNAAIVRDQVISLARSSAQKALGRSDVALIMRPNAGQLEILTVEDFVDVNTYTTLQSASIDMRSVAMAADVNVLSACDVVSSTNVVSNASPLVIEYDELGNLRRGGTTAAVGYPVTVSTGIRLCVNDNPVVSICFSPAGFALQGTCE